MKIKVSFELEMSPDNLRDWASEYGISLEEAPSDATRHLGALVQETVKAMMHVEEFTSMKNFRAQ